MKHILLDKSGNIAVYVVVVAIISAVILTMGIAFANTTKNGIKHDVSTQNSGTSYYTENISRQDIDDAAK